MDSSRTCSATGCNRPHYGLGLCKRDYDRSRRGKPVDVDPRDLTVRYEAHVDRATGPDACHPWTGKCDDSGYGRFHVSAKRKSVLAHRVGYTLYVSELAGPHVHIRHTCDNPPCQNPRHWLTGSHAQNVADMMERGRQQRGVRHYAAKLTEQDVRDIRARWADPSRSRGLGRALASQYRVTPMAISRLVHGKTWASVTS